MPMLGLRKVPTLSLQLRLLRWQMIGDGCNLSPWRAAVVRLESTVLNWRDQWSDAAIRDA